MTVLASERRYTLNAEMGSGVDRGRRPLLATFTKWRRFCCGDKFHGHRILPSYLYDSAFEGAG